MVTNQQKSVNVCKKKKIYGTCLEKSRPLCYYLTYISFWVFVGKYALVLGVRYEKIAKERNGCAMKKAYQKPVLYAESYELAEHIAACGIKLNQETIFGCDVVGGTILEDMGLGKYFQVPNVCSNVIFDKKSIQEYCYTNGCNLNVLHTS